MIFRVPIKFIPFVRDQDVKRITYSPDGGPDPSEGCYLQSTRSTYYVVEAHKMNTRDGANRWALKVFKVDAKPEWLSGEKVLQLRWHPRGKKR